MMRRFVLVILCVLFSGATLCSGQTIYILPSTPSSTLTLQSYAKKNTTVKWVALDGLPFTISFVGTPPCADPTKLKSGAYDTSHPDAKYAECKIRLPWKGKKTRVFHFKYSILHDPKRDNDDQQIFFQHVGSCDTCLDSGVPNGTSPVAPTAADAKTTISTYFPADYTETLSCNPKPPQKYNIDPDPKLQLNVGDILHWQNPKQAGSPKWKIEFKSATVCRTAPTFDDPTCEVTATPSADPYPYTVTVQDGLFTKGCTFDGYIKVPVTSSP